MTPQAYNGPAPWLTMQLQLSLANVLGYIIDILTKKEKQCVMAKHYVPTCISKV